MNKKILLAMLLCFAASLIESASATDTKNANASAKPAAQNSAAKKPAFGSGYGCRVCHGQKEYRLLPKDHEEYTSGDELCLGCHETTDGWVATKPPHIPHALSFVTKK